MPRQNCLGSGALKTIEEVVCVLKSVATGARRQKALITTLKLDPVEREPDYFQLE